MERDIDLARNALNPMEHKETTGVGHHQPVPRQRTAADAAQAHFERVVQGRDLPDEIPEMSMDDLLKQGVGGGNEVRVDDLMLAAGLAPSKAQVKRLLAQGAVERISEDGNSQPVTGSEAGYMLRPGDLLKVGKRRFVRLTRS